MKPPSSRPFRSGPRPFRGPRSYEERGGGEGDRPRPPRSYEERDAGYEERPRRGPSYGDRAYGDRPYSDRPYQRRSYGGGGYEDRPPAFRRPYPGPRREYEGERPRRAPEGGEGVARPVMPDPRLQERLKKVKLFLCDVDGILTDAGVYMGDSGETKRFSIRDGFGLRLLQRQGVKVGWISHRPSPATSRRAEDLQVDFLHQEPGSKVEAIEGILKTNGIAWEEVCFMGDDIVDLGALKRAGLAATVSNSLPEVKALAHYVAKASAGYGAVREVAEMILKAQDKWAPLVEEYAA